MGISMFDIDKMYGFYYNYEFKHKSSKIDKLVKSLTKEEIESIETNYKTDRDRSLQDIIGKALNSREVEIEVDGQIIKTNKYANLKTWLENRMKDLELWDVEIVESTDPKKLRHNRMMDIMQSIMKNPSTAKEIVKSSDFQILKDIRKEISGLLEKDGVMNTFSPRTHTIISERMLTGKQLIGPLANINSIIALLQQGDLELNIPLKFNGDEYKSLSDISVDGVQPSDTIGNWVAAIVDNGKDPLAGDLNVNWATIDTLILMLTAGIDHKTALTFLNQPIIREYASRYLNGGANLQIERKLNKEYINEENPSLEFLQQAHQDFTPGSDNKKVLQQFLLYQKLGEDLRKVVTSLKIAESGLGSSAGDTLFKINMFKEGMNVQNISGAKDLIGNPNFVHYHLTKILVDATKVIQEKANMADYFKGAYNQIFSFFDNLKRENIRGSLTKQEYDHLAHHLRMFLTSSTLPYDIDLKNNFYSNLQKFIQDNPDYADLGKILIYDKRSQLVLYKGIGTDQGKEAERYRYLIEALTEEHPEFARILGTYAFYLDGFGVAPHSFTHLLPISWYAKFTPQLTTSSLEEELSPDQLSQFYHQYIRNNYRNLSFVRSVPNLKILKESPRETGYYKTDQGSLFYVDSNTDNIKYYRIESLGRFMKGSVLDPGGKLSYQYQINEDGWWKPLTREERLEQMDLSEDQKSQIMQTLKKDKLKSLEQIIEETKNKPSEDINTCTI